MYIAYSALRTPPSGEPQHTNQAQPEPNQTESQLRYQAYQSTCNRYRHEIAAIQQYLPDWQPKFY